MDNRPSKDDEVRQAAIREREILLSATGVLNDADAVEGPEVPEEEPKASKGKEASGKG